MGSSPPSSRLTPLQRELLAAFFAREQRMFLTGGAALAGYHLGHRTTDDLDLFTAPGPDLEQLERELVAAASTCGGTVEALQAYPDFRRVLVRRGAESRKVDLDVDRAPAIDIVKDSIDGVRLDTKREIAANKICTLVSRCEIRDLVDLQALLATGIDLAQACEDALRKDRGADPATLAWLLNNLTIGAEARLPYGVDPTELVVFRDALVNRLRALAFTYVR
jgi:hypothetical protein